MRNEPRRIAANIAKRRSYCAKTKPAQPGHLRTGNHHSAK